MGKLAPVQKTTRMYYVLTAMFAYLLGSIPSGYLIGRLRGVDLRQVGSGNIGATNALRTLGKTWGYLCFVADFLKGFL
ncbi:MAG: glycerol-3-phosphate acyltransferase, partial [Chthoniobacterales bacterium]